MPQLGIGIGAEVYAAADRAAERADQTTVWWVVSALVRALPRDAVRHLPPGNFRQNRRIESRPRRASKSITLNLPQQYIDLIRGTAIEQKISVSKWARLVLVPSLPEDIRDQFQLRVSLPPANAAEQFGV